MDNGSKEGMTLLRMPQGGFLVTDAHHPRDFDRGNVIQLHFACTTISEALDFMRDKVNPIPPEHGPAKEAR